MREEKCGVLNVGYEDRRWRYGWGAKLRIKGRERGGVLAKITHSDICIL